MKPSIFNHLSSSRSLFFVLFTSFFILNTQGDAQLNPNQLVGHFSFTNSNAQIQQELAEHGLSSVFIRADSQGISPALNNNMTLQLSVGHQFDYQMTVESSADDGIQYDLSVILRLDGNLERYWLPPKITEPVFPEPADDVETNFSQCAAMADINFVNSEENPTPVTGGFILAYKLGEGQRQLQAQDFNLKNGSVQDYLLIEGDGSNYEMEIVYDFGDDFYVDKVRNICQVEFNASCDEVIPLQCIIGGGQFELGNIIGNVSVKGESLIGQNILTRMVATNGPFHNQRFDHVSGAGSFNLKNLVPSNVVDPIQGYTVYAEMGLRSGYQYQYLRTPNLRGANGTVLVMPSQTSDLSNTFTLDPGYIYGNIELVAPHNANNTFTFIQRDADHDANADGIPDNSFISESHVNAHGTQQKAIDSEFDSSGGIARVGFLGSVDEDSSTFNGEYELVLAGLKEQSSIWALNDLVLFINSSPQQNPTTPLLNTYMRLHNNQVLFRQINAGEAHRIDHEYCFSDVKINYQSLAGVFYNPRLTATGNFSGQDYRGQFIDYSSFINFSTGVPTAVQDASAQGQVVMPLPQGLYTITPEVTAISPDGSQTNTELPALTLEVGCKQIIDVSTDIQLSIDNQPQNTDTETLLVSGSIKSNILVSSIALQHNQLPTIIICNTGDCAATGTYQKEISLLEGINTITVIATAEDGTQASVSFSINYQLPEPLPAIVLTQCNDIRSVAEDGESTQVSFAPLAAGGCSLPIVECDASSDDFFSVGNHTVHCSASDECGQVERCEFAINIELPEHFFCKQDIQQDIVDANNTINVLWSPNHELVPTGYSLSLDNCDQDIIDSLSTQVFSDEDEGETAGTGSHAPDAVQTDLGLALRAERNSKEDGRVYLIISVINIDESESFTLCSAVVVPQNKSQKSLQQVLQQAKQGLNVCHETQAAPSNFYVQGQHETLGPKQFVKQQPVRHDFQIDDLWSFNGTIDRQTLETNSELLNHLIQMQRSSPSGISVQTQANVEKDVAPSSSGLLSYSLLLLLIITARIKR